VEHPSPGDTPDAGVPRETTERRLYAEVLSLSHTPAAPETIGRLERYGRWLVEEAQPAGGIGPKEHHRIADRHVADALMFLCGIPSGARSVLDVGSGVGLPGIPIAIARPDLAVTIVDRSRRRTDLAARALRILGCENVTVRTVDASTLTAPVFDVVAFRASFPPHRAADVFLRSTTTCGVGLVAVSRSPDRPAIDPAPDGVSFTLTSEGVEVLDSPFWLLRMEKT
jgi:16S rRNA (guanine527-N7)-methyltransferase